MKMLLPLLITGAVVLTSAPAANAGTFCVTVQDCPGTTKAGLQEALDAALQAPGHDDVIVGAKAGPYVGPFRYQPGLANAGNSVAILGVGAGRPLLTAAPDNFVLAVERGSVEGVDIRLSPRSTGLNAGASQVRDVRVLGAGEIGMTAHHDTTVEDVEVLGPTALGFGSGEGNVIADRIRIENAQRGLGGFAGTHLVLTHSRITAALAGLSLRGLTTVAVTSSTLQTTATGGRGVDAFGGQLVLDHVTVAHTGAGGDAALAFTDEQVANSGAAMSAVALAGYARGIRRSGGDYPITVRDSVWDPAGDLAGAGVFEQSGNAHVAPALVDLARGDLRPRGGSAAIDRDTLVNPRYDDATGVPAVDGDGNGGVRGDAGAFEYRRRAPVIAATDVPAAGRTGVPLALAANASDPDGDRLALAWTVDGRAVGAAARVAHTFAKRGRHAVSVRVRDEAGLTATRTFSVRVGDGTAPVLSAVRAKRRRGGGVRLRFTLSERARVRIAAGGRRIVVRARRGRSSIALRRLTGRAIAVRAVDAAGNRSRRRVVRLAVR